MDVTRSHAAARSLFRTPVRVLIAGFEPAARRAIDDPMLEMVPPRGDDLFFESFEVAAFDARQDPAAALALVARLRSEDPSVPALVLVARDDASTPSAARDHQAHVLRAPFSADDVREAIARLRPE